MSSGPSVAPTTVLTSPLIEIAMPRICGGTIDCSDASMVVPAAAIGRAVDAASNIAESGPGANAANAEGSANSGARYSTRNFIRGWPRRANASTSSPPVKGPSTENSICIGPSHWPICTVVAE